MSRDISGTNRTHRFLTCNIRVALPEDEASGNGWATRRELCIDVIRSQSPNLICFQEVLRMQMQDLQRAFPDFGSFGFVGPEMDTPDDSYQGIAKNPILYSRERYEQVSAGGFWLSETPHIPGSSSWGSARPRHVNWLRLLDRDSGMQFRVLSIHLDHKSQPAREKQVRTVLDEAATYPVNFPQILAGDFNARETNPVIEAAMSAGWKNSQREIAGDQDDGFTAHGFLGPKYAPKTETGRKPGPIDFILFRGPIKARTWKILRDERNGRFPSDHYFVAADLEILKS